MKVDYKVGDRVHILSEAEIIERYKQAALKPDDINSIEDIDDLNVRMIKYMGKTAYIQSVVQRNYEFHLKKDPEECYPDPEEDDFDDRDFSGWFWFPICLEPYAEKPVPEIDRDEWSSLFA